jgi:hypothetical protein
VVPLRGQRHKPALAQVLVVKRHMALTKTTYFEGELSLVWVVGYYILSIMLMPRFAGTNALGWFAEVWFFTWWTPGLTLSISGLRRGEFVSRICAGVTLFTFTFVTFICLKEYFERTSVR